MNFNIRHTLLIFHVTLSQWYCRSAEWSHLTLTEAFTEGIKFKLDLEDIMLSVVTQTEKDKEILYDFTYMWNLKTSNS